jgi:hypothetical protein
MSTRFVMHSEARRGWFSSTTLCGLRFKVERATWFGPVTCPACIQIAQQLRTAKRGKR